MSDTALPSRSTTAMYVVSVASAARAPASVRSLALAGISRRRALTNGPSKSRSTSKRVCRGSPAYASRSANAIFLISTIWCTRSALPQAYSFMSSPSAIASSSRRTWPCETGGCPKTRRPRYGTAIGSGRSVACAARSSSAMCPPSVASASAPDTGKGQRTHGGRRSRGARDGHDVHGCRRSRWQRGIAHRERIQ